jgi:8-oxo-dGTP diphosphatase
MNKTSHDSETAAHGQQVITACAFIHHDFDGVTKVFLPRRADTKKFLPGVYEIPGGHIDYSEDIREGLQREIYEELGVDIALGDVFWAFDYTNDIKGSHSAEIVYFATLTDSPDDIALDNDDHSGALWIAEDEIEMIMTENKRDNDPEIQALRKGFALLRGEQPNFG